MKACVLRSPAPIDERPLQYLDVAKPTPADDEALLRVRARGVFVRTRSDSDGLTQP